MDGVKEKTWPVVRNVSSAINQESMDVKEVQGAVKATMAKIAGISQKKQGQGGHIVMHINDLLYKQVEPFLEAGHG